MRTILAIGLLAACGSQAQPVPAQPTEPARPSNWWIQGEPDTSQPTVDPSKQDKVEIPPLTRIETVATEIAIKGVAVTAVPVGAAGWTVQIENNTNSMVSVAWDESTFVTSKGESYGRLIRGETRRIDIANAQPPTPVAPKARITQTVLVEKFLSEEAFEDKVATYPRRLSAGLVERISESRRGLQEMIVGGKLLLTIQLAAGKQTWTGKVMAGE